MHVTGAQKLRDAVKEMTGIHLFPHWWLAWKILTPALLVVSLNLAVVCTNELGL